jgi:hypothetical protein
MANATTQSFDYTYDGLIQIPFEYAPTVNTPDFLRLFTVKQQIKTKQQYPIAAALSKIVKKYSGCAITTSGSADVSNRTVETCEMQFRLEQCKDAFDGTVYAQETIPDGISAFELGNVITGLISNLVSDALRRDNFRIFSWGDVDDADDDYNQCDGLWRKLIDGEALYDVKKVEGIATLNQTDGTRAIDYFERLYTGAEIVLKQLPANEKKLFVTGNVFENYLKNLESTTNTDAGYMLVTNGIPTPYYRGIEVVPIYAWDNDLADAANPFNGVMNTAILYTTPANHIIGVDRSSNLGNVSSWYEKKDSLMYFEGAYKMGYNYLLGDLQAISYGTV